MTNNPAMIASATPNLPERKGETLYILYYRQGSNPHPQFLFFYHPSSDMKIIAERAKKHCDFMSFRFVYVRPAIVNLEASEVASAQG